MGDAAIYRDATEDEGAQILTAARVYIGTGYEAIGLCSGFVCKSIRDSVNGTFPVNGTVSYFSTYPGLRKLSASEEGRAGDVEMWGGIHMGFYDPSPPKGVNQTYTALTAMGIPGRPKNPGVAYGSPDWFNPQPPGLWRVQIQSVPGAK
jgi:hypothetical protein